MGRVTRALPQFKETKDSDRWTFLESLSAPPLGFLKAPPWAHSSSPSTQLLSAQRYLNSKFNVTHHLYTDDTQIYLELDSRNFSSCMTDLVNCLGAIQVWMGNNKLMLDKREFIRISDDRTRTSLQSPLPVSLEIPWKQLKQ